MLDPNRFIFLIDPVFEGHVVEEGHPECPQRLQAIQSGLDAHWLGPLMPRHHAHPASLDAVAAVHPQEYIEEFRSACQSGLPYFHSYDNCISEKSFEAAWHAVGGILKALDSILDGQIDSGFCAVRPPGHHAERNKAMGFCYFNNIAIAAKYLQKKFAIEKVLIIDFDVHHGNGTQHIFEEDPSVFYFSVHEHPSFLFPGTGRRNETGIGKGKGTTLNIPLPPSTGDDRAIPAFDDALDKIAEVFKADFILVSAGFDGYEHDPLAHLNLSINAYNHFGSQIGAFARDTAQGRVLSVLEGGYCLPKLGELCMSYVEGLVRSL